MTCFAFDKNFTVNGGVMDQNVSCLWFSGSLWCEKSPALECFQRIEVPKKMLVN